MPFFISRDFNGQELGADAENLKSKFDAYGFILIPYFPRNTLISDRYGEDEPL